MCIQTARIITRTCWLSDPQTVLKYALAFLGPVGISALIAFAVGVLFTGIGGINVAGGLLVGVITTKIYHLRRKQKLLEAEKALQEEIKNLKGFFERWKTIDKVLEDDDIPKALHLLSTSQESFDVVCNKLFKELEHPLMLLEKCYVCQSLLVPQKRFANLSQENLKIPRDYKYRMMSILLII